MKKLMMFSAAIVLALTVAAEGEAASVPTFTTFNSQNTLGIQRVAKGENSTSVPIQFEAVGGGDVTLQETLYVDNLNMADTVRAMQNDEEGYYTQWIWLPGFMPSLYWTARLDNEVEVLPSAQYLSRGMALRVDLAKSSTPVYALGQYTTSSATTILYAGSTSYIANPAATEPLNVDQVFHGTGFSSRDQIFIPDGASELCYQYDSNGDPAGTGRYWYRDSPLRRVENGVIKGDHEKVFDLRELAPGEGFRYYRGGFSNLTIHW